MVFDIFIYERLYTYDSKGPMTYKDLACLLRGRLGTRYGTRLPIFPLHCGASGCLSCFSFFSLVLCQIPLVVFAPAICNRLDRVDVLEARCHRQRSYSSGDIGVVASVAGTDAPWRCQSLMYDDKLSRNSLQSRYCSEAWVSTGCESLMSARVAFVVRACESQLQNRLLALRHRVRPASFI
jgi:hypothetical protein